MSLRARTLPGAMNAKNGGARKGGMQKALPVAHAVGARDRHTPHCLPLSQEKVYAASPWYDILAPLRADHRLCAFPARRAVAQDSAGHGCEMYRARSEKGPCRQDVGILEMLDFLDGIVAGALAVNDQKGRKASWYATLLHADYGFILKLRAGRGEPVQARPSHTAIRLTAR